jgi:hypothetical protein
VLRVMVPVSLHREQPGQASGNQGTVMLVALPVGEPDPVRRLELIAAETAAHKHNPARRRAAGSWGWSPSSAPGTGPRPASAR